MTVARPVVVACGDILGVAFDGEDEAVLFAPHSGDVLISEVTQWRELISPRVPDAAADAASLTERTADSECTVDTEDKAPAAELRAALRQLGVQFG